MNVLELFDFIISRDENYDRFKQIENSLKYTCLNSYEVSIMGDKINDVESAKKAGWIPILIVSGYLHYKKTSAFKAEADINIEVNPHWRRMLTNTDLLLSTYVNLIELILKITNHEKLSEDELKELTKLKESLKNQIDKRTEF